MSDPVHRRRLLVVSPHFPPTNAPDHQRVRTSLAHYRDFGWEPTVLAVTPEAAAAPRDELLAEALPADVRVIRSRAVPLKVAARVGVGNLGYRAWASLRSAADQLARTERIDLVFFSTTQFLATTLGRGLLDRHSIPYVIDIQDPWRTDYYSRPGSPPPPGRWKHVFARLSARLEGPAWSRAAGFISVSAAYLDDLCQRYEWFDSKPAEVIPIGAAAGDFAFARSRGVAPAFAREPGCIHLACVGAVGAIMRPALEHLFGALSEFRRSRPKDADRLRLFFIGTSYAQADRAHESVRPIAEACEVGDLVREQTARVGHFTAIQTLLQADALILPGSDDTGYNPSRLGIYYLAEKPVLALAKSGSSLERAARALGAGWVSCFDAPTSRAEVAAFLAALVGADSSALARGRNDAVFRESYEARSLTGRQCELFAKAVTKP